MVKGQDVAHVTLIPDGNGEFTEGMNGKKTELGFGKRSWRYSMLVKDARLKRCSLSQKSQGDPFKVSDAETMLINPSQATKPKCVSLFTKVGCPFVPVPRRC